MDAGPVEVEFVASRSAGVVHGILERPADARALLVLAHGAGAGMRHPFLAALAAALGRRDVAVFRWQFPYMEQGSKRPDPQPLLLASVRAAVAKGRELAGGLPLFAGGKSMGGRMTSLAAAREPLPGVAGLVFFGFPLHPAGKPSTDRAAHLESVDVPMLFLQGTRDALAELLLLQPIVRARGAAATLHVLDGADHSFHVLKRSGRTDAEILEGMADAAAGWMAARSGGAAP